MRRFAVITILFVFGPLLARAQDDSQAGSGSVYSAIGIGIPVDAGSSSAAGMGLRGVSYVEPFVPGFANPAHWGSTVYGIATGGITLQQFDASDFQGSSTNTLLSANYFQLQFPLLRNKVGISALITPLTRSAFQQIEVDTKIIGSGSARDTVLYQSQNQGGGGVNMLELGVGWNINSNISIGYAASLVFASMDEKFSTFIANNEYTDVQYTLQTSGTGFGNRFGVQLNFPAVLGEADQISLGASLMLPVKLEGKRIERAHKTLGGGSSQTVVTEVGENLGEGIVELPATLNAGLTYYASRMLSFTAEGLYQNWSDFSSDFNSRSEQQMITDRYKIGVGLRYFPYISGSDKFLSGFKYRLGATYDSGHLKINGQHVETLMFSFGLGILAPPSPRSNSSIDISFEYGFRGTKIQNLVKETIWGLRLSVNLAELMFFRPKLQ